MPRHVALLRGINVGKHKRIAMADLRAIVAGIGHTDVRTHLNSGNVAFTTAGERDNADLARELERAITEGTGLDVPVVVRSGEELVRIVANNPFPDATADPMTLHVAFLGREPAPERVVALAQAEKSPDDYRVARTEIYLSYPNKLTGATFMPDGLDRALGVDVTMRNWRTVIALAEMSTD